MEHILGKGGHFLRARDPEALQAWYRDSLGLEVDKYGGWEQQAGPTVFAVFEESSDYFGRTDQQVMLNFRVRNLAAMLDQLRQAGAAVDETTQVIDGVGGFGWVTDPEGNRIELWEPSQ
jgi:predicted enzyme related to lactoylglutathione lyase